MFCTNCGAQIQDGSSFCPNCGARQPSRQNSAAPQQPAYQQNQGYQQPPYQQNQGYQQPTYQQPTYQQNQGYQQPVYRQDQGYQQQAYQYYQPAQQLGMKWHKFLVYFSLWASALFNVVNGFQYLNGDQYGTYKNQVYRLIPELKTPDTIFAILCFVTGILSAVTAYNLLKFKKNGPKLLLATYGIGMAASLLYVISASVLLSNYSADLSTVYSSAALSLVVSIVMIIANSVYYKKRAHLFVN